MAHIPKTALDEVKTFLPGLSSPTVTTLHGNDSAVVISFDWPENTTSNDYIGVSLNDEGEYNFFKSDILSFTFFMYNESAQFLYSKSSQALE